MLWHLPGHCGSKRGIVNSHRAAFQEQGPLGVPSVLWAGEEVSQIPFNEHFRAIEANSFSSCLYLQKGSTAKRPFIVGASC